jgi:hypothetical protein
MRQLLLFGSVVFRSILFGFVAVPVCPGIWKRGGLNTQPRALHGGAWHHPFQIRSVKQTKGSAADQTHMGYWTLRGGELGGSTDFACRKCTTNSPIDQNILSYPTQDACRARQLTDFVLCPLSFVLGSWFLVFPFQTHIQEPRPITKNATHIRVAFFVASAA